MKKSAIHPMPAYFDRYINLVEDIELGKAFEKSVQQLNEINMDKLLAVGTRTYAPGKWTLHDIFQHLVDSERIFSYRALRIARNDRIPLPGFDQEDYAANAMADRRPLNELLEEFKIVRRSTILLFQGFDDQMLIRTGICNNKEISALAIGFLIIGHQVHHFQIIEERYLRVKIVS